MVETLNDFGAQLGDFLSMELWQSNNFRLSVKGLLQVFAILLVARFSIWTLSRTLSTSLGTTAIEEGRRYTIVQISKYLIYTVAFVIALETIGVKVTAILAASTALFVGLGLGLQDAFKDLSSGVIILMERTLSVGDIIQMGEQIGKVESVGLRTTAVRTRDDILIIMPNHKMTNETVVNLTHSEDTTRFSVRVGVAYGTDTAKVKEILQQIAADHPESDPMHDPQVILKDFGDSALIFELFFYTRNLFFVEKIKSEIRFEIDRRFRESGITIPFPQRTVWHM
ncbi:MAG: mechanosensitive ion channel family protein, partial [Schleiferiaceae bacterium]